MLVTKDYCHRVTIQSQLVIKDVDDNNNNNNFLYKNWSLALMEASERVREGELWKMFEHKKKQFV